jgi:hypothetical protein
VSGQQAVLGTTVEISSREGSNAISLGRSRFIADDRQSRLGDSKGP